MRSSRYDNVGIGRAQQGQFAQDGDKGDGVLCVAICGNDGRNQYLSNVGEDTESVLQSHVGDGAVASTSTGELHSRCGISTEASLWLVGRCVHGELKVTDKAGRNRDYLLFILHRVVRGDASIRIPLMRSIDYRWVGFPKLGEEEILSCHPIRRRDIADNGTRGLLGFNDKLVGLATEEFGNIRRIWSRAIGGILSVVDLRCVNNQRRNITHDG